jgi:hypothetical protein
MTHLSEVAKAVDSISKQVEEKIFPVIDSSVDALHRFVFPPVKVVIKQKAFLKMYYMAKNAKDEIGGLLVISKIGKRYIVRDVILLPQKATPSEQTLDMDELGKFIIKLAKTNPGLLQDIRGWWHSHADMGVFWSGQDKITLNKLNRYFNDYFVAIELNRHNDWLCRIENKEEKHDNVEYEISGGTIEGDCKDEIKDKVKEGFF